MKKAWLHVRLFFWPGRPVPQDRVRTPDRDYELRDMKTRDLVRAAIMRETQERDRKLQRLADLGQLKAIGNPQHARGGEYRPLRIWRLQWWRRLP